jgi:hypothetical protein
MDFPSGMETIRLTTNKCLLIKKSIYGLVQSAHQFYKKLMQSLKNIGFTGGLVDPCLLMHCCDKIIVYVACYVDEIFVAAHEEAIKETIELIKGQGVNVKVEDKLTNYLSSNIVFNHGKSIDWLRQPHDLIKSLERKFGSLVEQLQTYCTPGTPGNGVVYPKEEDEKVSAEDQALY